MAIESRRRQQHQCDKGHRWVTWNGAWKECPHHPCPKCPAEPKPAETPECDWYHPSADPNWRYCPRCGVAITEEGE